MYYNSNLCPFQYSFLLHLVLHTDTVLFSTGRKREADHFLSVVLTHPPFYSLLHQVPQKRAHLSTEAVSYTHLDVYKRQELRLYLGYVLYEDNRVLRTCKIFRFSSITQQYLYVWLKKYVTNDIFHKMN